MPRLAACLLALGLAGCASPDVVGQQVGQSLYNASVNTGRAVTAVGDQAGYALQSAGTNLRNAVSPPPPPIDSAPSALPPPYAPNGFDSRPPIEATPLPPAY